jgi:hypothetical protein
MDGTGPAKAHMTAFADSFDQIHEGHEDEGAGEYPAVLNG